jgi:protein-tyrosine phosphatase
MIDYHCHLLPGLDDGSKTIEESISMARLLVKAGYSTVYCTPHLIKNLYEPTNDTVREAINALQRELDREEIAIKLLGGREYYLDSYFNEFINNLMPLDNTRYLLIEIPAHTYPGMVRDTFSEIIRKGLTPLIAHPERCHLFHEQQHYTKQKKRSLFFNFNSNYDLSIDIDITENKMDQQLLNWLYSNKCGFQCNLPSFIGVYGELVKTTAMYFKNLDIYTHFGTDAHSTKCLEKLFDRN